MIGLGNAPRRVRALALLAALFLGLLRSFATPGAEAAFDAANQLYAQNKFAEAASTYTQLVQSNGVSAALLFNLGNAHYRAGQVGLAIAAYRQAAQLAPRDPDLRANLQFLRGQVQGPTVRPNFFERGLSFLSRNEWAGLGAAALWITFGLLALRQFQPRLASPLRLATRIAAVVTVFVAGALAYSVRPQAADRTLVVLARETPVRITPNDEARAAFTVNDGSELHVLDRKGDWLQVSDGSARNHGWLKSERARLP